ncbi:MAG TPA: 3-hydroxyacyl-CoA dehydrogenase NAD-binding domain-containing protein, partial [Candidatus Eremiobacteraceae bacterium]|nr:3-hydroxyacyl-CoA dehydrogenase NAD-binding domain-containing protein [Candidatus Eremiobacteraceae bacterium]
MRVLVIGAGQMGGGIAHVCAAAGHDVLLNDVSDDAVQRGVDVIANNLRRAVSKGKLTKDQADATLSRVRGHLDLAKPSDVSIAIEAASEDEQLKKRIFTTLDAATPPDAILASNTSSISITTLGAVTKRPERVIG